MNNTSGIDPSAAGTQPRWGWIDRAGGSQGSACRATLGYGKGSRWDANAARLASTGGDGPPPSNRKAIPAQSEPPDAVLICVGAASNRNAVPAQSEGLRGTRYPGWRKGYAPNPKGVASSGDIAAHGGKPA